MPTPASGSPAQTVLHWFINNGRRYAGFPGLFHVEIPADTAYFNAMQSVAADSDIPTQEKGETDPGMYGVLLVGDPLSVRYPDPSSQGTPTPMSTFVIETNRRSVAAENSLAQIHAKLDQLLRK